MEWPRKHIHKNEVHSTLYEVLFILILFNHFFIQLRHGFPTRRLSRRTRSNKGLPRLLHPLCEKLIMTVSSSDKTVLAISIGILQQIHWTKTLFPLFLFQNVDRNLLMNKWNFCTHFTITCSCLHQIQNELYVWLSIRFRDHIEWNWQPNKFEVWLTYNELKYSTVFFKPRFCNIKEHAKQAIDCFNKRISLQFIDEFRLIDVG